MSPIDWRELYAANRAAIDGHHARPHVPHLPHVPRREPESGGLRPVSLPDGRPAFLHAPAGVAGAVPLLVMLHGCTQTAASFAAATGMNAVADRHGFAVLYPEQRRADNQNGCWNWFEARHQGRGAGEPASIVGAVAAAADATPIDLDRVFVAGLSAGGAMAAVLAATYPDRIAGFAIHSGLAYGAATGLGAAFGAMTRGGPGAAAQARAARAAMGPYGRVVPTIVVHGGADRTVSPLNGEQALEQWMATNRLVAPEARDLDADRPDSTAHGRVDGGHAFTRRRWTDAHGRLLHEHLVVDGLGHAWSGGASGAAFADPRGPDASEAIAAFLLEASAQPRPAIAERSA